MNRLSPERLEQMRARWALHPRKRATRIESTPIKYAPWWSPWRGWILLIAWFFFAKQISPFRWIFCVLCLVFAYATFLRIVPDSDMERWTYCVLWGNPCYR